jgi:lipoprotein NlpI
MKGTPWRLAAGIAVFGLGVFSVSAQSTAELNERGMKKYRVGDLKGALEDFGAAIALDPSQPDAYFFRACVEFDRQEFDAAQRDADHLIVLKPGGVWGYIKRGEINGVQKRFIEAISDLDTAISIDPSFAIAFSDRGFAKQQLHDLEGAAADLNRAIELDGKFARAYGNRAELRYRTGDISGAAADTERFIALMPNDPGGFLFRGELKSDGGDFDGALADTNHALALKPGLAEGYYSRARVYLGKRDYVHALPDLDAYISLGLPEDTSVPYARFSRHLCLAALGRGTEDDLAKVVPGWKEGWPKTVGLFLVGGISREEFQKRALAADTPSARLDQRCECGYYLGVVDRLDGRTDLAKGEFRDCLATGRTSFIEYRLSKSELAALKD